MAEHARTVGQHQIPLVVVFHAVNIQSPQLERNTEDEQLDGHAIQEEMYSGGIIAHCLRSWEARACEL